LDKVGRIGFALERDIDGRLREQAKEIAIRFEQAFKRGRVALPGCIDAVIDTVFGGHRDCVNCISTDFTDYTDWNFHLCNL
jgi:hypothetical protein